MKATNGEDTLEWLSGQNLSAFRGKWIVAFQRKILGSAKTLERALNEAKLPPAAVPFVMQVPEEERLAL